MFYRIFIGFVVFMIAATIASIALCIGVKIDQRNATEKASSEDALVEEVPFEVLSFDESHSRSGVSYWVDLALDGEKVKTTYDENVARAHDGAINKYDFYRSFEGVKVGDEVKLRVVRAEGGDYDYFLVENVSNQK